MVIEPPFEVIAPAIFTEPAVEASLSALIKIAPPLVVITPGTISSLS